MAKASLPQGGEFLMGIICCSCTHLTMSHLFFWWPLPISESRSLITAFASNMLCSFWDLIYQDGESHLSFAIISCCWIQRSNKALPRKHSSLWGRNILTKKTKKKLKDASITELKVRQLFKKIRWVLPLGSSVPPIQIYENSLCSRRLYHQYDQCLEIQSNMWYLGTDCR